MIDQLVGHIQEEHSLVHEHLMSALLTIVREHPRAVQECQRAELDLHNTLQKRISDIQSKEEFLVIILYVLFFFSQGNIYKSYNPMHLLFLSNIFHSDAFICTQYNEASLIRIIHLSSNMFGKQL